MVRLMDLIDVHNSIDTMKFSSFVYEALDPIRFLAQ